MRTGNLSSYEFGLSGIVNVGDFIGLEALDIAIRSGREIDRESLFRMLEFRFLDSDP